MGLAARAREARELDKIRGKAGMMLMPCSKCGEPTATKVDQPWPTCQECRPAQVVDESKPFPVGE